MPAEPEVRLPRRAVADVDGPRTINLKLSNPMSGTRRGILGYPSTAVLVIADDDTGSGPPAPPTFQLAASSDVVSEGIGTETLYVIRSGDLSSAASG